MSSKTGASFSMLVAQADVQPGGAGYPQDGRWRSSVNASAAVTQQSRFNAERLGSLKRPNCKKFKKDNRFDFRPRTTNDNTEGVKNPDTNESSTREKPIIKDFTRRSLRTKSEVQNKSTRSPIKKKATGKQEKQSRPTETDDSSPLQASTF
jgi:phosphoserine aminotransferase